MRADVLRPATPEDAPAIARIHIETWQIAYRGQLPDAFLDDLTADLERRTAFWRRWLTTNAAARQQAVLVSEAHDEVVGFVSFGPCEDEPIDPAVGQVYAIYVHPSHWDVGHGRALLAAAVNALRERGLNEATLWVLETNERARRFYEIAGWLPDRATKTEMRGSVELREMRYRASLTAQPRGLV